MDEKKFSHAGDSLRPVASFDVGGRDLLVYSTVSGPPGTPYVLYWYDEAYPFTGSYTANQVFELLDAGLSKAYKNLQKEYLDFRGALRDMLDNFGVASNPAVENNWILMQLAKLLEKEQGKIKPGVYQHYKGNFYFVSGESENFQTREVMVKYYQLYGEYKEFVRRKAEFFGEIVSPQYEGPRYRYKGEFAKKS